MVFFIKFINNIKNKIYNLIKIKTATKIKSLTQTFILSAVLFFIELM